MKRKMHFKLNFTERIAGGRREENLFGHDVVRVDIAANGMLLTISRDDGGDIKIHESSGRSIAVLPCAANAVIVRKSRR